MPASGTRAFLDADRYEASLRQAQIDVIIASGREFKARFTWAELHHLQLLRCEEDHLRIAYLSLAPSLVFVAFPAHCSPLPMWRARSRKAPPCPGLPPRRDKAQNLDASRGCPRH